MTSSDNRRSSHTTTSIHDSNVVDPINVRKESVAKNASEFRRVLSTPPQRKERGKKRGRDDLNAKTELNSQQVKKRKCRPKVADDKFSLKVKKVKVKISKPVKVRRVSPKKDSQSKRKYVRKKKQQPDFDVRPPEATDDAVGIDVVVTEETLLVSAKGEVFKESCRRALEFNDENLTNFSTFTAQSPEDGLLCEKAVQPHLFGEEKLSNHEAEERYISSDDLLSLAAQKDSRVASRETLDYEEVNTVSTTVDMSRPNTDIDLKPLVNICSDNLLILSEQNDPRGASRETLDYKEVNTECIQVDRSEPSTDMDLKASEAPRPERDISKNDHSTVVVYVRKRKTRSSINIQNNVASVEVAAVEEVGVNENESRAQTVHGRPILESAGQDNITDSRRKGLNSGVVNDKSVSQTNKNKNSDGDHLAIQHVPLISNGRNMRACQCIQLMRKRELSKFKIRKQKRMQRKQRVDMSRLLSSFQTPDQLLSKEPTSQIQKVSIPTRRKRSKRITRSRAFLSPFTFPPFIKLATRTLKQQPSLQVPETDVWPTHDSLVTTSKGTLPSGEEKVCVRNEDVNSTEEPQPKVFDPIFTINEHLFVRDMSDDRGFASQNCVSMQSDSPGLDCSTMNALSFPRHSANHQTYEEVPVHNNVYSMDNFYPSPYSVSPQTGYPASIGAGQHPLMNPTYDFSHLLSLGRLCVTNEQESIFKARGGIWTTDDPNLQNLLYSNQLPGPHCDLGPGADADNYDVNSHLRIPYCEPSKLTHEQELLSRVDNSMDANNGTGSQSLIVSVKKKKVIPHVNFDSKTMPMWRALMGIGDSSDHRCNDDEESKKWWREERRVFDEKVQVFISSMHKIQGNRRFSQWKGSVLDSVMGVFLTQNVSDHLSSSAYMSLAAKYPIRPRATHSQNAASDESEVIGTSQESCGSNEVVSASEPLNQESLNDMILDGKREGLHSVRTDCRNEFAEKIQVKDDIAIPLLGLSGFEEWLSLQEKNTPSQNPSHPNSETEELLSRQPEQITESQISFHPKSETQELLSHQPGPTTHSQDSTLPKSETDELPSHQQEQGKQHQDSTPPKDQKSKTPEIDWLKIKTKYCKEKMEINEDHTDSVDWDAVRRAPTEEVADAIKKRGQHNILAASMQKALNRIFSELGSLDLEWLRDTPPDVTKDFLLSIDGLGLKSVECIRLLALEQVAFPVDTNVGRIAVRLGWVDLKDVPEGLEFHLLEQYPMMDAIQKYLWPRLCELDQLTLYELHYQLITFGKVFCKKRSPYCNACPLRASCKYFASAYVSARLPITDGANPETSQSLLFLEHNGTQSRSQKTNQEPIVEIPPSPRIETPASPQESPTSSHLYRELPASPRSFTEMPNSSQPYPETPTCPQPYIEIPTTPQFYVEIQESLENVTDSMDPMVELPRTPESDHGFVIKDIEDLYTDDQEIPTIELNHEEFIANLSKYIDEKKIPNSAEISNAIVTSAQSARIPARKLKNVKDLRTEHLVYEIPDDHPLLRLHGLGKRDSNDQCVYLLSIWSPGEFVTLSSETMKDSSNCAPLNSSEENGLETNKCQQHDEEEHVFGTFMIPCRTAMRGRFPLNGTYFQVNEVFADDESSHCPIKIPRSFIWNLNKSIVYCGSSASSITTGLTVEEIQLCFWRDYICVRGFNRKTGEPKDLAERLHTLKTSATQTKRSRGIGKRNPKKNKNEEPKGDLN